MAFFRPTLADLIVRAYADIQSRLPGSDATLRRSNLNVLSRVHSAAVHGLYGFIQWLATQIIFDTAEAEYLERWASIWKIYRIPASFATGTVTLTGTNGVTIPALTELQRADGALYTVDADVDVAAGTAVVAVTAVEAGQTGNATAGYALTLTTPIGGITAAGTAGALSGGAAAEKDDALRARFIARIQQPPHGGAAHDYVAWALEVAGVTRAWVYPQELGAGTVTVRFVRDNDASLIPDAGEVTTVQDYIDERRTVTAKGCYVVAPIADPLDYSIAVTPNTQAVKDAVTAELTDLISRESVPGGTLLLSHQRAAISAAAGETNYNMTAPVADVVAATGHITTLGVITWL
jgi:uncharacterized phage protein gp47/JayE